MSYEKTGATLFTCIRIIAMLIGTGIHFYCSNLSKITIFEIIFHYKILTIVSCESESHSVVSDSLRPHGLYSPWNSPGQNTGVCSLSLLQGIFPTHVSCFAGRFFTSWAAREALCYTVNLCCLSHIYVF